MTLDAATRRGIFLAPGEGRTSRALNATFSVRVGDGETNGAYVAFEFELPPGAAVPPHVHPNHDETVYVVGGQVTNRVGDHSEAQDVGSVCFIPKGTVHGQTNDGSGPTKLLLIVSPGDVDHVFGLIDGRPTEEAVAILAQHGVMEFIEG